MLEPTFINLLFYVEAQNHSHSSIIPADHWPRLRHRGKGQLTTFLPQLCQLLGGTQDKPFSLPALVGLHLLIEQVGQMFFLSL